MIVALGVYDGNLNTLPLTNSIHPNTTASHRNTTPYHTTPTVWQTTTIKSIYPFSCFILQHLATEFVGKESMAKVRGTGTGTGTAHRSTAEYITGSFFFFRIITKWTTTRWEILLHWNQKQQSSILPRPLSSQPEAVSRAASSLFFSSPFSFSCYSFCFSMGFDV